MIYREALDHVGRLLTLAIRGERHEHEDAELAALHQQMGDAVCREAAQLNQVEALVADALSIVLAPEALRPHWRELLAKNEARVTDLIDALGAVGARLTAAGCRWAAIEGGGVMLSSALPARSFCPSDIDLLVAQEDWAKTAACFEAEGFASEEREGRAVTQRREYQRGKLWLGVGCVPFERKWVPLRFSDCSGEWLARAVDSRKDPRIKTLDATDGLAFVAMHTSLHSYIRAPGVRLHVDVDRLVRDNAIDWPRFVSTVQAMGVGVRAFTSLSMAAGLLATPVSQEILEALHPGSSRWRRIESVLAGQGVISNGQPKLGGMQTIRLDALLDEQGSLAWLAMLAVPPAAFMRQNYSSPGDHEAAIWRLHLRRMWQLATRWRPQ
jgi:hypothetical protein